MRLPAAFCSVATSWLRSLEIVCRSAADLGTSDSVRSVPSSTSASAIIWRTLSGTASRPSSPMPMTWIWEDKVSGVRFRVSGNASNISHQYSERLDHRVIAVTVRILCYVLTPDTRHPDTFPYSAT